MYPTVSRTRLIARASPLPQLDQHPQGLAEECRRQSRLIEQDQNEQEVLDWLEQVADIDGWGVVEE